jgi:hypothetical protein
LLVCKINFTFDTEGIYDTKPVKGEGIFRGVADLMGIENQAFGEEVVKKAIEQADG